MDDDDKIRRNLVVVSTVIIAAAWLDTSIPELIKFFFSTKPEVKIEFQTFKLWIAILVLLIYFCWRYRWAQSFVTALDEQKKAQWARYLRAVQTRYFAELVKWTQLGDVEKVPSELQSTVEKITYQLSGAGRFPARELWISLVSSERKERSVNVTINAIVLWNPSEGDSPYKVQQPISSGDITVEIDSRRHLNFMQDAFVGAFLNSKPSMDVAWPFGLAAVAAAISVYKLADSLV